MGKVCLNLVFEKKVKPSHLRFKAGLHVNLNEI